MEEKFILALSILPVVIMGQNKINLNSTTHKKGKKRYKKMAEFAIFTLIFLCSAILVSGKLIPPKQDTEAYHSVEQMPVFPAQYGTPNEFLASKIIYPDNAIQYKIMGKIFLQFVIDELSNIIRPQIIKGLGYGCDEAAFQVLA